MMMEWSCHFIAKYQHAAFAGPITSYQFTTIFDIFTTATLVQLIQVVATTTAIIIVTTTHITTAATTNTAINTTIVTIFSLWNW